MYSVCSVGLDFITSSTPTDTRGPPSDPPTGHTGSTQWSPQETRGPPSDPHRTQRPPQNMGSNQRSTQELLIINFYEL